MKKSQKQTAIWMLSAFIVIVVKDIILAVNGTPRDTFSEVIRDWYMYTGGLFFALGYLIAHWGWFRKKYIHIAISMTVLVLGGFFCGFIQSKAGIMPIWYVLPGVPLGHIFWPQHKPKDM